MTLPELGGSGFARRVGEFLRAYLLIVTLYLSANQWHWRAPSLLPELAPDRWIPFAGWSVWVYASHFLFLPVTVMLLRDSGVFRRALRSMLAAGVVSFAVFVLYPTAVTRQVPVPPGASGFIFDFLFWVNTPANCIPSLHVSLVYLGAFALREDRSPWWIPAFLWASAISLSTMTTKEHYFLDVAGGMAVAAACRWFSESGRWERMRGTMKAVAVRQAPGGAAA